MERNLNLREYKKSLRSKPRRSPITSDVSCLCATFMRPEFLEEAVYSFLTQDFVGKKELIIVNDCKQQTILFNHPDVRIFNVDKRFRTMGEKRNFMSDQARSNTFIPWDDDDICLPWRISLSIEKLKDAEYFKPKKSWVFSRGKITKISTNIFHAQSAFSRKLFYSVGGYPKINSGQDAEIENKFIGAGHRKVSTLPLDKYCYIYKWAHGDYHLSGYGRDTEKRSGYAIIGRRHPKEIGEIRLNPHYNHNYEEMVKKKINDLSHSV